MSESRRSFAPLVKEPVRSSSPEHAAESPPQRIIPGARSFFEKSSSASAARSIYLKTYFGGTFMMVIILFTVLPIYWGALYMTPVRNLKGWVVDFDSGLIGQALSQALETNQGPGRVTWEIVPASRFPGGPGYLAAAIRHEDAWTAISINPGSSDRITVALSSLDPSYDGSAAVTAYAVEARNENAFRSLIRPSLQGNLDVLTKSVSLQIARSAANSSNLASILANSPQTIVSPVGYTIDNLIPFDQPVATAATFAGMLYQLILGFFVVMISNGAREASGLGRTLSARGLIILRLCSSFFAYFIISLFYCLMNLAFHIDTTRQFGHGGFMVFWMINYIGMLAMALALESLITILTPRGMPPFMLLWIICLNPAGAVANLAVTLFPIDALPSIFHYGYAAPFYNLSRAMRTIIFGTRNRVGQSVGILFAWIVLSCITLTLFQWHVRRRAEPLPNATGRTKISEDTREKRLSAEEDGEGIVLGKDIPKREVV